MKIYDVEINDLEAIKAIPADHQEALFAHLSYYSKKEAVKQLQEALRSTAPTPQEIKGTEETMKGEPGEGIQINSNLPPAEIAKPSKAAKVATESK